MDDLLLFRRHALVDVGDREVLRVVFGGAGVLDDVCRMVDAQISFTTDASGAVSGLVLHQNGRDQAATKIR